MNSSLVVPQVEENVKQLQKVDAITHPIPSYFPSIEIESENYGIANTWTNPNFNKTELNTLG